MRKRNTYAGRTLGMALSCLVLLTSCNWEAKPPRAEPTLPIHAAPPSYLTLPVDVAMVDLAAFANAQVPQELVRQSGVDMNCPAVQCTSQIIVTRGLISFGTDGGRLRAVIPLVVDGRVDFRGPLGVGRIKKEERATARVFPTVSFGITEDWAIRTTTSIDFTVDQAEIHVGPARISLRGVVSDKIRGHMPKLSAAMDQKIASSVKLRPAVENVWPTIHQPIRVQERPAT